MSSAPIAIVVVTTMTKKIRKNSRYFRLRSNLAQRKLIDLANHRPSFMPYDAVGAALGFFELGSEMASGSRRTRERLFTRDEALQRIFEDENSSEGMSSGEESDFDRQFYDLDENFK